MRHVGFHCWVHVDQFISHVRLLRVWSWLTEIPSGPSCDHLGGGSQA